MVEPAFLRLREHCVNTSHSCGDWMRLSTSDIQPFILKTSDSANLHLVPVYQNKGLSVICMCCDFDSSSQLGVGVFGGGQGKKGQELNTPCCSYTLIAQDGISWQGLVEHCSTSPGY